MLNEFCNVNNLSNDEQFKLIFELMELDKLTGQKEADCFIDYLTSHPTPIREAVAYKLEEFIAQNPDYFKSDLAVSKMLDAISDINPNISRVMCNIIEKNETISGMLISKIIDRIDEIISKIKSYEKENKDFFQNKIKNKKNHAKNKLLFSLYWYLEALSYCNINNYKERLLKILNYTIDFCDYTIREKTAKILNKLDNPPLELLQKAKYDQNFYVQIQVYDKMNNEDLN